jgi:PAS domain S-box-containing protein
MMTTDTAARWPKLLRLVLLFVVLPVAGIILSELHWESRHFVLAEPHSVLEVLGASIGFLVGIVLLLQRSARDQIPHPRYLACGLVSMAVFDVFHAAVPVGDVFVLLHALAMFFGSFFIYLAWTPRLALFWPSRDNLVTGIVGLASALLCVVILASDIAPSMTNMGRFTLIAGAINGGSVLLFCAAAVMFGRQYLNKHNYENTYFFVFCGLHVGAGALFSHSTLWNAEWWLWHVLRVAAYLMLAMQVVRAFRESETRTQENELRLKTIAETARDGIVQIDRNGLVTYWNRAAQEMFGYPEDEMLGEHFHKAVATTEDFAAHSSVFGSFRRTGKDAAVGKTIEFVGIRKDGTKFPVDVSLAGVLLDGNWTAVGTIRDATERKRTEDLLRRRTEELQRQTQQTLQTMHELELIIDSLPGFVFYKDARNNLIRVNSHMAETYGMPKSDIAGKSIFDLHWPDSDPGFWADDKELTESKQPILNLERSWESPEGKTWVLVSKIPVTANSGEVTGVIGIAIDITERKETETRLQRESSKNAVLLENNSDGIHILDLDGNVVETNIGFCTMLRRSSEEVADMNVADWDASAGRTELSAMIRKHFDGQMRVQFTTIHRRKDGSLFDVEISGLPLRLDGVPLMFYSSRDITERLAAKRKMEETMKELAERNSELKQFAYVASHDLRAPLRAIDNLSQWIEEDLADQLEGDTKKQMVLLRDRVHRMEALISGLLAYSRVGRTKPQQEEVDVANLLNEIIALQEPHQGLAIHVDDPMPSLVTDRLALEQVFLNLISNAIQYHDKPDGNIDISAADHGEFYCFSVSDDGPGIASEYHKRIFAIFQTLGPQRDGSQGTGIGLAIVKKQVSRMGGTIEIESSGSGGTVFRFTWPKGPHGMGAESHIATPMLNHNHTTAPQTEKPC